MRNLVPVSQYERHLNLPDEFGEVAFAVPDDENKFIYVGGTGLYIACIAEGDLQLLWTHDLRQLANAASCALPIDATFSAFIFASELESICVGLSSGHLLLIHPHSGGDSSNNGVPVVEEVGEVQGGVVCASWSPDGDAVAILGGQGQLLLMTSRWDLLCESHVFNDNPAFPQPTAPPGSPRAFQEDKKLASHEASLCWRGDGRYFATCTSFGGTEQTPRVRIWDRESGELHALGERDVGLQGAMDWQPNGRHLYVAQGGDGVGERRGAAVEDDFSENNILSENNERENAKSEGPRGAQGQAPEVRHVGAWKRELKRREEAAKAAGTAPTPNHVVLFERNGLRHGSFDVPSSKDSKIETMCWSPNSEVLAIVLVERPPTRGVERAADGDEEGCRRIVQLWHRSNWHWYLKHERCFACCAGLSIFWEESGGSALSLLALTAEGSISSTTFVWDVCVSALGTAAVIDGASVLLTPLGVQVVPPPMCAAAMALPAPAVAIALRQCCEDEAVAAVLSDGRIAVVHSVEADLWEESLEEQLERAAWDAPGHPKLTPHRVLTLPLLHTLDIYGTAAAAGGGRGGGGELHSSRAAARAALLVRQVVWVDSEAVLLLVSSEDGDILMEVSVNPPSGAADAKLVAAVPAPGSVVRCACRAMGFHGAVIELEGGELWSYECGGEMTLMQEALPTTCPRLLVPPCCTSADRGAPVGLSASGDLYWGKRLVAREVTSCALRHRGPGGAFLVCTARGHAMCTILLESIANGHAPSPYALQQHHLPMQQLLQGAEGMLTTTPTPTPGAAGGLKEVTLRAIEENALLIAVPANDVEVVYQAPRGNLEVVRPRALVLPAVAAALDAENFAQAWSLATVNRLDLNVLVDYRWPRFLSHAESFLQAIGSDTEAADFLATLTPGSVTSEGGLYATSLNRQTLDPSPLLLGAAVGAGTAKVAEACLAIRRAIVQDKKREGEEGESRAPVLERGAWLRTELTSFSQCGDLEGALVRVKCVKDTELAESSLTREIISLENGSTTAAHRQERCHRSITHVSAEQGLKHLLIHSSEEEVYRAALGLYELELAYMVVAHSQRDPGEYLIELQRFAAISCPNMRHHAIDVHLRRFDSALRHLLAAGEDHHDQVLALARQQGLLRLLIQLAADTPALRAAAQIAAGEELEHAGRHEDAALAFVAGGDLERGMRAYRLALQWQPALALAARLGRGQDRIRAMAARLASDLADGQRQAEAAALMLEYLDDVPAAVELFAAAGEWRECVRVAYTRGGGGGTADGSADSASHAGLVEGMVLPLAAAAAVRILETITEDTERLQKYWMRLKELRGRREAMAAAVEAAEAEAEAEVGEDHQRLIVSRDGDMETEAESMVYSEYSIYTRGTGAGTNVGVSEGGASTVGGRHATKKKKKGGMKKKGRKVRQGSPEEEAQVARHVLSLYPSPALCAEVGQLVELLVTLGHEADAGVLQRKLKELIDSQREASQDVVNHPPPGEGVDVTAAVRVLAAASGGGPTPLGVTAAAAKALEKAAAGVAGPLLQTRASEAEAGLRGVHWKWEILRDP